MRDGEGLARPMAVGAEVDAEVGKREESSGAQGDREQDDGEVFDPTEDGDVATSDREVQRAAAVLMRVAPEIFKDLCDRCNLVMQQRLSSVSLSGLVNIADLPSLSPLSPSGAPSISPTKELRNGLDLSIVCNQDNTTPDHSSNPDAVRPYEKRRWSEEHSSGSDTDEQRLSSTNNQISQFESPSSDVPVSKITKLERGEELTDRGRALAFYNEKFDFAWANVTLSSPRTAEKVDRHRPAEDGFANTDSPSAVTAIEGNHVGSNIDDVETPSSRKLSPQEREKLRLQQVERKKDFECIERIRGKPVNVAEGLELHKKIFSSKEQERLVDLVYDYQQKGRSGLLRERTYSEPRKWMRGKGRVTIQFGCCYNYAVDKHGNPPGIMHEELVDPLPNLLKASIRRLVKWHVLPETCVPDSCIINLYDEGDCIPPHIDHHDFVRPFCTLSLLSECNIVFGSNLSIIGPGDFDGPLSVPLPVGSVLVLKGNGADIAKHAVPAVPTRRISITFRKMDPLRVPRGYQFPEDLRDVKALPL